MQKGVHVSLASFLIRPVPLPSATRKSQRTVQETISVRSAIVAFPTSSTGWSWRLEKGREERKVCVSVELGHVSLHYSHGWMVEGKNQLWRIWSNSSKFYPSTFKDLQNFDYPHFVIWTDSCDLLNQAWKIIWLKALAACCWQRNGKFIVPWQGFPFSCVCLGLKLTNIFLTKFLNSPRISPPQLFNVIRYFLVARLEVQHSTEKGEMELTTTKAILVFLRTCTCSFWPCSVFCKKDRNCWR